MKIILILNIVALATAFSFFIGETGVNYFFIGYMVFSLVITKWNFLKPTKINWDIYLLPIFLLISGVLHIESFRVLSYLYGLLFILFFINNLYLIRHAGMSIYQYQKILKQIIYAYFFTLIIQQAQYLTGHEDFFNKIFADGFKFNALATEPSYAGIVIVYSFYSYIKNQEIINQKSYDIFLLKKERIVWLVFVYEILTIGSSFGILLFLFLVLTLIKNPKYLVGIVLMFTLFISLAVDFGFVPLMRVIDTIIAVNFSGDDYSDLILADHSASVRIIPILEFFKHLDFYTIFGKGMDFSANYFPTIIPGVEEDTKAVWLLPSFIIDNGIVCGLLLARIIYTNCIEKFLSFNMLTILLVLLNTSFNTQLFWFTLTLLTLNKYFSKNYINISTEVLPKNSLPRLT